MFIITVTVIVCGLIVKKKKMLIKNEKKGTYLRLEMCLHLEPSCSSRCLVMFAITIIVHAHVT